MSRLVFDKNGELIRHLTNEEILTREKKAKEDKKK